jgi:3-hydroxyisobutyrate dehydrogenase
MDKPRVSFLGLGIMGTGMARRLLAAGFPLTVYNRNAAKAAPLVAEGAKLAPSPRAAAADAEIVVTMVSDDDASRALWLGPEGVLAGAPRSALLIEASTLTVRWVEELAKAVAAHGNEFLDAPVTGSKNAAAGGELNFFVGGTAANLEKARPVLAAMSRSITLVGPTGSGARIKLINNFLSGVQAASLAEAMAMIERSGLNRTQALEIVNGGAPGSPILKLLSGRMTAPDYTTNFPLRLMGKDLAYAIEEAGRSGVHLATATAALAVFQNAIAHGHGDKDMSAVAEPFRKRQ